MIKIFCHISFKRILKTEIGIKKLNTLTPAIRIFVEGKFSICNMQGKDMRLEPYM
jgi:hypothetical protein